MPRTSESAFRRPHTDPAVPDSKARNVKERLPKPLHASVRRAFVLAIPQPSQGSAALWLALNGEQAMACPA
jgi:hypothetical protein